MSELISNPQARPVWPIGKTDHYMAVACGKVHRKTLKYEGAFALAAPVTAEGLRAQTRPGCRCYACRVNGEAAEKHR